MNVLTESAVSKYCDKCKCNTKHRLVKESRPNRSYYYGCSVCSGNNTKKHRIANWYKYLAQKANSRKRSNSIKLVEEDILLLAFKQDYKCALTNEAFNIVSKWWKPSLDRIDSNLGYTKENIRLVAWIVNHARGELTDNEFVGMCSKVTKGATMAKKSFKKFEKKEDKGSKKDAPKDNKKKGSKPPKKK
mgnify:CR=1 FL=1